MLLYLQMVETEEERDLIELFYNAYKRKMMRVAISILHNDSDAEEAVHQSFLRLCNNSSLIPKEICHKTEGFFVLIVRNIAIDLYRKQKKNQIISYDEEFVDITSADTVEDTVFERLSQEKIAAMIVGLPQKYNECLILKYYYGHSDKDCAKLLGTNPEALRKRLERARKLLAAECIKEGIVE